MIKKERGKKNEKIHISYAFGNSIFNINRRWCVC